jgi:aspartyl-tRNA(Asn)/glutamyl-tRNA(Gln) amidotransferase subunit B
MYKVVIGLEVHCELLTNSKNFSSAKNTYSTIPNVNVAPVDLGLPGILPVVNKEAVKKALKTAMALNCTNPDEVIFDRKNYYYPDLPKGYQITQVTKPMGRNGYLTIIMPDYEKKILIHQLHLEEDTASLEHYSNYSLIDYNRSGIPLMEIVTEPCISSSDEAVKFLETLRSLFIYCGVSEAKSDKGQMRCDVNVSIMKDTDTELGTKVEMKNINSFNSVKLAIEYEIKRQTEALEKGEKIVQETRRFSEEDLKTYSMREKVDAVDYKYFVEPNMPAVALSKEYLDEIRSEIPRLQYDRYKQYINEYNLSSYDAEVLIKEKNISDYFEDIVRSGINPKDACNWVTTVILGSMSKLEVTLEELGITSSMLAGVISLVEKGKLSQNNAKKILYRAMDEKKDPLKIIEEENLSQINDIELLTKLVNESLDESPDVVEQFKSGKDYVANYFIGSVMKKTKGQANPTKTLEIIKTELGKR